MVQDGREATLQPGDFTLLDAQRPFVRPLLGEMATALLQDPASRAEGAPGAEFATHRSRAAAWVGHQRARLRLPAHDSTTHRQAAGGIRRRGSASRFSISPPLRLRRRAPRIGRRCRRRGRQHCCDCALKSSSACPIPRSIRKRLLPPLASACAMPTRCCRRRSVARAADRIATSRALPYRFVRRQTSAPHDRRYRLLLGLLRPVAFHAPLQGRLRLYP